MINTIKNIVFITFLLGAGFIVLAIGWGGSPFNTAGNTVNEGAGALGDAAQGVHDLINNVSESISAVGASMQMAGEALWRPIEKLSTLFGSTHESKEPAQTTPHETVAVSTTQPSSSDTIRQDD